MGCTRLVLWCGFWVTLICVSMDDGPGRLLNPSTGFLLLRCHCGTVVVSTDLVNRKEEEANIVTGYIRQTAWSFIIFT